VQPRATPRLTIGTPPQIIEIQSPSGWSKEAIIALCSLFVALFGTLIKLGWPNLWSHIKQDWNVYTAHSRTYGVYPITLLPVLRLAVHLSIPLNPIPPLSDGRWKMNEEQNEDQQSQEEWLPHELDAITRLNRASMF
jgi:hypothetical protein